MLTHYSNVPSFHYSSIDNRAAIYSYAHKREGSHMHAKRMEQLEGSGIRRIFELGQRMKNPIDFSLGQAHFDAPKQVKEAAMGAIQAGKNRYTVTAGIPELRDVISREMADEGVRPESILVTCGAEGGLLLSILAMADESVEVLVTDPCFATYGHIIKLAGSKVRWIDTYPDFRLTPMRLEAACTEKSRILLFNSPVNPTGVAYTPDEIRELAHTAKRLGLQVISDEVYDRFCYDYPHECFAKHDSGAVIVRAFSKTWGVAGWRIGFAFGPKEIIGNMTMLQQFTFICAPAPFQWAAARAIDTDVSPYIDDYRRKRDFVYESLSRAFELNRPEGAFYAYCRSPNDDTESFMKKCIENEILVVPGSAFSTRNTHFRVSFATDDETLKRGIEMLVRLAK